MASAPIVLERSCGVHASLSSAIHVSSLRVVPVSCSYSGSTPSFTAMTIAVGGGDVQVRSGTCVVRAAAVLLLATGASACVRSGTPSAPPLVTQVAGTIAVDGLEAPVKVIRD